VVGLRAIDTLDEFDVVLADEVEGHVALHRYCHLREDVLVPLAHREQRVGAQRVGLVGGAGRFELGDLLLDSAVRGLGRARCTRSACHRRPHVGFSFSMAACPCASSS